MKKIVLNFASVLQVDSVKPRKQMKTKKWRLSIRFCKACLSSAFLLQEKTMSDSKLKTRVFIVVIGNINSITVLNFVYNKSLTFNYSFVLMSHRL